MVDENDAAVQALNDGDTLTDSFNYTVQDGGLTDTAVLTISINGANDAPVAVDDTSATAGAAAPPRHGGTLNATGNVTPPATSWPTTPTWTTRRLAGGAAIRTGATEGAGTAGTLGGGLAGAHGTLTLVPTAATPMWSTRTTRGAGAQFSGRRSPTASTTPSRIGGLTDTAVLTISINGANDAPVAVNDTSASEKGGTDNDQRPAATPPAT